MNITHFQVNICLIQASLVEEIVSISALDHAEDLTCVSLLSACLDNISCQLLMNNVSQKMLQLAAECSPDSSTKKTQMGADGLGKHIFRKQSSAISESGDNQRLVERQQEDMVGSLSVNRIHLQLRRMKQDSNHTNSIYLTAIPEHRSKMLFTFEKPSVPVGSFTGTGTLRPMGQPSEEGPSKSRTREFETEGAVAEEVAGFIMFECGLDDISLRAARRTGYTDLTEVQDADNNIEQARESSDVKEPIPKPFTRWSQKSASRDSMADQVNARSEASEDSGNNGNTADDEASGPTDSSKHSNDMSDGEHGQGTLPDDQTANDEPLHGDASSGVLQVKSVWFNFAAPPPSLRKKKLEYTR